MKLTKHLKKKREEMGNGEGELVNEISSHHQCMLIFKKIKEIYDKFLVNITLYVEKLNTLPLRLEDNESICSHHFIRDCS
jgi:hypothetical protein